MRSWRRVLFGAGSAAALVAVIHSQGCGSSGGGSGVGDVLVTGEVIAVTEPPVANAPASRGVFAFWRVFGPSQAVAQASCPAEDIFVCLQTSADIECSAVDETTCQFSVDIDVDGAMTVFFVKDEDNDNSPEEGEAVANLTNELGELCTGLTIALNDVTIDFTPDPEDGTATAATVDREPENCPTPTATPGGENTPTPTPTSEGTPEPTATPTATPTETPA